MRYRRMPIEIESPEELGYDAIANNLSESSCSDMRLADYEIDADVSELLLQYGDHRGLPHLRELIAADGPPLGADDVIVTAGAAAALFAIATALLGAGEHAVVASPNYATNLETPLALGAEVERLELRFEDGWELDLGRLEAALRPQTRLLSLTYPHNPTGAMIDRATLEAIVDLVERHGGARLLVDETYRELAYGEPLPIAASLSKRAISVSSMSKTFGLPGLRIGWLACGDPELSETLLAAKEQILICGATLDEEIAFRVLAERERILPPIRAKVERHLEIVRAWIEAQDLFEWVEPRAGVVCFPRLRDADGFDPDRFYDSLLREHGTYVGPGHWFGQPRHAFRLGFAWPRTEELERGLAGLAAAAG
ncbi:MAG: aminotransferase class I/II-fold pyridoxal phosphate-dependent enzyme [Vicinamibacteria bacterium]|jgi:aspartate/methionine/tyrosine aminotransferase